jgi:quercetin dioxygenase-like cupin family protein
MKTFSAFMLGVLLTVAAFLSGVKTGVAQDPVTANPEFFKVLAEDERVRVIDDKVPAGAKVAMHSHPPYVVYPLSSYRMKFTFPDGTSRIVDVEAGKARIAPPIAHAEENIGTTEAHALLVELKEPMK